jgi:PAS domain-containing protein
MPERRITEMQINPVKHASRHAVQFYEQDSALVEALGRHIGTALESGDTAIVIATKVHREKLAEELRIRKINVAPAIKAGLYIELDAAETLAKFMVGGGPDKQKFQEAVGALIREAATRTKPGHRLVAFGEMVALLWAEGKRDATIRLEEFWNELAEQYTFDLLCGYPISVFDRTEHRQLFFSICGEHGEVNPAEGYPVHASDMQRRRSTARLHQKAKALESEIRLGQERVQLLQQVTRAGTWELDIVNDTFSFSSAAAKLLGFPSSSRVRLGQLMDLMYYSGDRETVFAKLQTAQRHRKEFKTAFRLRQDDSTRIVAMQGKTFYNGGSPLMLGVISDVTPLAETNTAPATFDPPDNKAAAAS